MCVGSICVREVDLVGPSESVQAAATRLGDRCVGALIACDEAGRPIGVLTDRDIALRVVAERRDPDATLVYEVMSKPPDSISEGVSIDSALSVMRAGSHRRLPVVGPTGELVGILCLDDILDLLADEFSEIGTLLRRESPRKLAET